MLASEDPALVAVLNRAQELGFLGPGLIEPHIDHAERFARAHFGPDPKRALDLGSGGGLPGLVLATTWPQCQWVLLDANERRTTFLQQAVNELGLVSQVEVVRGRAEELAHLPHWRASRDLVTARSFGPPAVTAECAAGFLHAAGMLIVSEPPDSDRRWDVPALESLGLTIGPESNGCQVLIQSTLCPTRYPRRVGIPAKRPLF